MGFRKCHVCVNGRVDGGFGKMIKKRVSVLKFDRDGELDSVRENDVDKLKVIRRGIFDRFNDLINVELERVAFRISSCGYCHGKGFRFKSYGVD